MKRELKNWALAVWSVFWIGALAGIVAPAHAQNPTCPTRPVGTVGNACASLDFVGQNAPQVTSVTGAPFFADPTGTNDSTTAINNAILSLPLNGGPPIYFPCGTYKISNKISIGNGVNGTASTRSGITLMGATNSLLPSESGAAQTPCVQLSWAGSAGGTMVEVDGVLQGWGIQNIAFQCGVSNSAGFGLHNISGQYGDSKNLSFANCTTEAFGSTTWTTLPAGFTSVNALHNYYSNVTITVPNVSNAIGMALRGDTSNPLKSDTAYDEYHNFKFVMPQTGALTTRGLYVGPSDSSYFHDFHFVGGVAQTVEITFDYSQTGAAAFPQGHVFVGLDPSGSLVPPIRYQAIGTQTGGFPNYIYGLNQINGAGFPAISGLCASGVGQIQLCGQVSGIFSISTSTTGVPQTSVPWPVAAGGTGDTGTAWSAFTATPTCGTGTITTNGAKNKVIGKTTFIQVDFTISTLGTCGGANNFQWTLPNVTNNTTALAGRNAATGLMIQCGVPAGTSTATCSRYDNNTTWAGGDRLLLGGVYENQ